MNKGQILLEALLCFMLMVILVESLVLMFSYSTESDVIESPILRWQKDCPLTCALEADLP